MMLLLSVAGGGIDNQRLWNKFIVRTEFKEIAYVDSKAFFQVHLKRANLFFRKMTLKT